jgi:hypothetical protein
MNLIYPIRTGQTLFDYWTLAHLSFWFFIGTCLAPARVPLGWALVTGVLLAYAWEVFERLAEVKWPELWHHPESALNAYVSDPLTAVLAICVAYYGFHNWRP